MTMGVSVSFFIYDRIGVLPSISLHTKTKDYPKKFLKFMALDTIFFLLVICNF